MEIISASRREDMPAFRPAYLAKRFHELGPDKFWVLWTKNPQHISGLKLDLSRVAMQLTVTGLGKTDIEPGVPSPDHVWNHLEILLREGLNPQLVNWRMDPLIPGYHSRQIVSELAARAADLGITRCMVSFITWYGAVTERWPEGKETQVSNTQQRRLALYIREILEKQGIALFGCAQPHLQGVVIPSKCIDGDYYARVTGYDFNTDKDKFQRPSCGCTHSNDIGKWISCGHGCRYCYANPQTEAPEQGSLF